MMFQVNIDFLCFATFYTRTIIILIQCKFSSLPSLEIDHHSNVIYVYSEQKGVMPESVSLA